MPHMYTIKVFFINFNMLFAYSLQKDQVRVACGLQYQHVGNSYRVDNHRGRVVKQGAFT